MTETSFLILLALILLPIVALSVVIIERSRENQERFDQYLLLAKELKLAVIGSKESLLSLIRLNGSHSVSGLYKTYHVSIRYRYMKSFPLRGRWANTCLSLTAPALTDINPDKMLHQLANESGALFKGDLTLENGMLRYEERGDVIDDRARRWMVGKVERLVVIADKLSYA